MIPTKEMTPYVPVTVAEIIENVHEACEIGITMVHLHARDEISGAQLIRVRFLGELSRMRTISQDLIICVSLSGRGIKEFVHRASPLQLDGPLKPDMGSLTLVH